MNGRKSRGPVTAAGKEKSKMNAVTHGLFIRAIPSGRMPVFADRREFIRAAQKMASDLGVVTTLGRSLVDTLAMDLLRLRHVRSMELAILDPGSGNDRELDAALRDRDSASCRRGDEENDTLLRAYSEAESRLGNGSCLYVTDEALPLMTADLWRTMNEARTVLERDRQHLRALEVKIAETPPCEAAALRETRLLILEDITTGEQDLRDTDRDVFLVSSESDITAYLSGRKRIAPAQRQVWADLMGRRRRAMEYCRQQVMSADFRIDTCRRRHLLASVDKLDSLNRLGEYEDRIRRSISKTTAMIRDVECSSKGVIDIEA
ncbi:MAG: hypothetical protein PHW08_09840 [Kiritimatiellae bacterium]|nr:hypothetical protein [Kiritimatiellia bacterium]